MRLPSMSSARTRAFDLDGNLLLLSQPEGRIFFYNPTAALIWHNLEDLTPSELADAVSSQFEVPFEEVERDIEGLLAEWRSHGLIAGGESDGPAPEPADAPINPGASPAWNAQWRCVIRGQTFEFAVENEAKVRLLQLFFGAVQKSAAPTDCRFEVREIGGPGAAVWEDGKERLRTDTPEEVPGALSQFILEKLYPGIAWRAIIHAGAVALNGAAAAFPAVSGSGKSTLVAALSGSGFDYLSDDFVPISSPGGCVVPWPVPQSIKSGSWDVLSLYHPALKDAAEYQTKGFQARLLPPPPNAWDMGPVPLRCLIFPRYAANAGTQLEKLTPGDAARRLLGDRIWLGYPLTEAKVEEFVAWMKGLPAYALSYGNLDEAVECVRSLLGGPPAP